MAGRAEGMLLLFSYRRWLRSQHGPNHSAPSNGVNVLHCNMSADMANASKARDAALLLPFCFLVKIVLARRWQRKKCTKIEQNDAKPNLLREAKACFYKRPP